MKKNIKLKIEVQLTSEDEDKIERLLMELISKTSYMAHNGMQINTVAI